MNRKKIDFFDYIDETNEIMRNGGLLLVSKGKDKKPNAMTIGWGFLGTLWRKPYFIVAVRKSRHTYKLIEESNSFTVCLPSEDMDNVLDICGTKSGRDIDKFKELNLTAAEGNSVETPFIEECPIHYECKIKYKDELKAKDVPKDVLKEVYPEKDLHTLYYGEVLSVWSVRDAADKLA